MQKSPISSGSVVKNHRQHITHRKKAVKKHFVLLNPCFFIFSTNIRYLSCAKRRCSLSQTVALQMIPISRSIPCGILKNHIQQKSENVIHAISVKNLFLSGKNLSINPVVWFVATFSRVLHFPVCVANRFCVLYFK